MRNLTLLIIAALASYPVLVSAQAQSTPLPNDSYHPRYQPNLPVSDGIVNMGPTATPSPAAGASVAPIASPATVNQNIPIEGSQVNKTPTSTGTGTFTPSKNITIENSQFQNNAAVSNTTGASSQTTTTSRVNSKRNVTDVGQSGGERSEKKKKQKQ